LTLSEELRARARGKFKKLERCRRDPRYLRAMGRFVAEGLLTTNQPIPLHEEPVPVSDVLWAGDVEPRLLELLPALLVKRPSMFVDATQLPDDLALVVRRLRRNLEPPAFRGVPGPDLYRWLPKVGRRDKVPARLKSFRFKPEDLDLLRHLSDTLGLSETEVLRRGLRALLADLEK
jgi:hypothetical protein